MSFVLRPKQELVINETRAELRAGRNPVIEAPTGFGKTVLSGFMLHGASQRKKTSIFVVHRNELLDQSVSTLEAVGIEPGVIASGYKPHSDRLVQVAMVQTLANRVANVPKPDLMIVDEAQHMPSEMYRGIVEVWSGVQYVGLSATPERLDGKGLGTLFDSMVHGPSTGWLIDNGFLAPYRAFAPPPPDVSGVGFRAGGYAKHGTEAVMTKPTVTGDIVSHWFKLTYDMPTIAFCASVKASEILAQAFRDAGVAAVHVDGDTPKKIRKQILADFRAGNIKVLCNVDLFGEGLDVPGVIVAILARPTGSLGLHRQQIGRVLRFQPGKTAYILDHAGNLARHGMPDDEIKWSLEGRAVPTRSEMESRLAVRSCPACFAVSPATAKVCESCGQELPKTPREIKQIEGELKEIEKLRQVRERKVENRSAKSEAQLVELAKLRGYKNPHGWAAVQIRLRANKGRL